MRALAALAIFLPIILTSLIFLTGVLAIKIALVIGRAVFWLAVGGLIGIALWSSEVGTTAALLLATPAHATTVVPSDWVIEARHCANSPEDTAVHTRGFAIAFRQWRCVNGHVFVCDPIGTNADCSIVEYWTPVERDADEIRREQSRQAVEQTQQAKDDYLRNAQSELATRLMYTGTAYHGPAWRGKIRIHIASNGRIDHLMVVSGERNMAFLRQLQFQLGQINLGSPPPGCEVMDTDVEP